MINIFRIQKTLSLLQNVGNTFVFLSCLFVFILTFGGVDAQEKSSEADTVKIGLLISEFGYKDARRGAELAVKEANKTNFLGSKNIKLITKSMEGPWGTGAKQAVDLVFNEKVWAIIGSHDGRNAHLAEQVIAKTQVVFISAWSGDPTLAQAYVPWFFSMVPNNIRQAESLYSAIYSHKKSAKVLVLADDSYDAGNALGFFLKYLEDQQEKVPSLIHYKILDFKLKELIAEIEKNKPDILVLFSQPHESLKILKSLPNLSFLPQVFGTFTILGEDPASPFRLMDFQKVIIPDIQGITSKREEEVCRKYINENSIEISPTALYAYDAMWLSLKKIKESGFDRDIFKQLMRNSTETGLTGDIRFDKIGNRTQAVKWVQVQ